MPSRSARPAASTSQPLRIGLVGCGAIGAEVARVVYAGAPQRYSVVAAIDPIADRAAAVGELLSVPRYPSVGAALEAGCPLDAVDLRLPHHLHADATVEALRAGRHVLAEKPLAVDRAGAQRIIEAARMSTAVAAVAENYPHLAAVQAARRAVEEGAIGTIRTLRTTRAYTLSGVWVRDGWRQNAGPSAGVLLDQGTHHASLARQLGGDVVAVSAASSRSDLFGSQGETVLMMLRFASGLIGQSLFSWGTPARPDECEAEVFGSRGRITIRVSYDERLGRAELDEGSGTPATPLSDPENYYASHRTIVEDWVAAVRGERSPLVTVDEAAADLAVVLAARESLARGGGWVAVAGFADR